MTHLAITDTNGFYGLPNFLEIARKHKIAPIVGVQVTARDGEAVLLARAPEAYPYLSELVSRRHLEETFSLTPALIWSCSRGYKGVPSSMWKYVLVQKGRGL